jgi:hypothetical protein
MKLKFQTLKVLEAYVFANISLVDLGFQINAMG